MYTGPGYLSAFLGVANMVLLVFLFREIKVTRRYQVRSETRLRKVVAGKVLLRKMVAGKMLPATFPW